MNAPILLSLPLLLLLLACQSSPEQNQKKPGPTLVTQSDTTPLADPPDTVTDWAAIARNQGFDTDYLMGRFSPARHPDFVPVARQYADREGMYLHRAAYDAFLKMRAAAAEEGITMTIRSATRNFDYQKGIWEAKWHGRRKIEDGKDASRAYPQPRARALKILEYSSMPGTSRHHWGTDMDFNSFSNAYFETGEGLRLYTWMQQHAATYGFCRPYTAKGADRPNGYNEEKWHWSYTPLSRPLTALAAEVLRDEMIEGFDGAEVATEIGVVQKYVLGIAEDCR